MYWTYHEKLLLNSILPTEASLARLHRFLTDNQPSIDWASIAERADFHQLTPLLRYNLFRADRLDALPSQVLTEIEEASRAWAARHLAYVGETTKIINSLKSRQIVALPLKGAALMLAGYYPETGLRSAWDIDLIVDPSQIQLAEKIVEEMGYLEIPGRRHLRPRQRLPNELNHQWPRRGSSGLLLELHHRAFHASKVGRDLSYDELLDRAVSIEDSAGDSILLPSAADLALHLIHHTMVDLQSAHMIVRTFADLHFIFLAEPEARATLADRAKEFGFSGIVEIALRALSAIAEGSDDDLALLGSDKDVLLLLETGLMESTNGLAGAARLLEYFDFSRNPAERAGNIFSLIFTPRAHMEQLYGKAKRGSVFFQYLRRPFDLAIRLGREGLSPSSLIRARRLKKLTRN